MKSLQSLRIAIVFASLPAFAIAQFNYQLTNLTTGSPFDYTQANGVNASGHVTGYGVTSSGEIHAFIYANGTMSDLGLLGYQAGIGISINNSDDLAADGEGYGTTALFVSNGSASTIGDIDGNFTYAFAINNPGDIVGLGRNDDGGLNGFSWIGGTFTDLAPYGILKSVALNDNDDIVGAIGYYWAYGGYLHGVYHGCLFSGGVATDLGNLSGDPRTNTEAFGINNSGQIVGYSFASDGLDHAFLYSNGTMQDLGTMNSGNATAIAINNHGLVVGNITNAYGANLGAFVDWDGQMSDLSGLIAGGGSGWSDFVITGVGDDGSIVGYGNVNGAAQGFLLTLPLASWSNYGNGFAGTNGIPSLTAAANPVLGSTVTLDLGNSLGATTPAIALVGFAQASLPTGKGGTLLVVPSIVIPLSVPAAGLPLTGVLPDDPALSGSTIDLQAIEIDAGAAKGFSFTRGLELDLGE